MKKENGQNFIPAIDSLAENIVCDPFTVTQETPTRPGLPARSRGNLGQWGQWGEFSNFQATPTGHTEQAQRSDDLTRP